MLRLRMATVILDCPHVNITFNDKRIFYNCPIYDKEIGFYPSLLKTSLCSIMFMNISRIMWAYAIF